MSREDIVKRLESLGLIGKQITEAYISMRSTSMPEDDFPVCDLKLIGVGRKYEADNVTLTVTVDGSKVKDVEIPVVSGDSDRYIVTVDGSSIRESMGKEALCVVKVTDRFGRELVSSSSMIQFGVKRTIPKCKASVDFVDELDLRSDPLRITIASVDLSTDIDTTVCIDVRSEGKQIWCENVNVPSSGILKTVSVDTASIGDADCVPYEVSVKCEGNELCKGSAVLKVIRNEGVPIPHVSLSMNILGELDTPEYVDTHIINDGTVEFGTLVLINKDPESHNVILSVMLDGEDIICSRDKIDSGRTEFALEAPFSKLARDDTYSCEIITHVTDEEGNMVMHKISTINIRSKYDMDIRELATRTAQFINPSNPVVRSLIDDAEGPLAKAMSGGFTVMGYQLDGKYVYRQVSAVYRMMHDIGMKYVSDTFTFDKKGSNYQRVRTPDKVFSDRSGNCIELSIFYASLLEAMGFETVIVYPTGHAIVGVVFGTDAYRSQACISGPEAERCGMIELEVNGKSVCIIPIETTLCPYTNDFDKAVETACETIDKDIDRINRTSNYCIVKMMRQNGIDPMIGL